MKKNLSKGANALVIKDLNIRLVLKALKLSRISSIRDLSDTTGLTIVTVNGIIQNLILQGRVSEGELVPSQGGRPSRSYVFNEKHKLGLVIFTNEINSQDTLCLRITNLHGDIVYSEDHILTDVSLEKIEGCIHEILRKNPAVAAIGFGFPGIELDGNNRSREYENYFGAKIVDLVSKKIDIPFAVENNVNLAVLGRGLLGDAPESEVYIYFSPKTPPGAGIRIEGKLIRGAHRFAGEIGWLPLGINWGPSLTDSFEDFTAAASSVVLGMVVVLDPDSVVISGEFITPEHLDRIRELCIKKLPQGIMPEVARAEDFRFDFERGLTWLTLNLIES